MINLIIVMFSRFNEAAGIPRGRRHHDESEDRGRRASMRPRVFPAEDDRHRGHDLRGEYALQ